MVGRNLFAEEQLIDAVQPATAGRNLFAEEDAAPDFTGAGIIEPVRAIASGVGRSIVGGLAGIEQAFEPIAEAGAGARAVEEIQAGAFQPKTEAGKKGLETLTDLIQKGVDIVNIPLSGLGGIAELVSGQGIDQAVETIKAIQQSGVPKQAGERVFEETGSPLAATVAETAPAAIGSVLGFKGVQVPAVQATRAATESAKKVFKFQTPTKQKIADKIASGSSDIDTAKFTLSDGRAIRDKVATETIRQGFDEGVVAAVKSATPVDRTKMQEMVSIMEKGKKNARFGALNRPADIAGKSLTNRVKFIQKTNRQAGTEIDKVAKTLRGQPIDIQAPVRDFAQSLDDFGVKITRNEKGDFIPDFKSSELAPGDRGPIREVIRQMSLKSQAGDIDALTAHQMKRIIDRNVTFGKVKTGISGDAERVLKKFRVNIDEALDTTFPEYNAANIKYAETIGALDKVQDAAGRKLDFSSPSADKASGTALRRLLSNTQSRANFIDAIDEIERVVKSNGGKLNDDLLNQVLFVDELDRVFGPVARTSLQGQVAQAGQAAKRGVGDIAIDVAVAGAEKLRGINEANAFKSIKELLK